VQLEAVKTDKDSIRYIKKPTKKVISYLYETDKELFYESFNSDEILDYIYKNNSDLIYNYFEKK